MENAQWKGVPHFFFQYSVVNEGFHHINLILSNLIQPKPSRSDQNQSSDPTLSNLYLQLGPAGAGVLRFTSGNCKSDRAVAKWEEWSGTPEEEEYSQKPDEAIYESLTLRRDDDEASEDSSFVQVRGKLICRISNPYKYSDMLELSWYSSLLGQWDLSTFIKLGNFKSNFLIPLSRMTLACGYTNGDLALCNGRLTVQ